MNFLVIGSHRRIFGGCSTHFGFALALSVAPFLVGGCADRVFRCESATQCQNNGDDGTCQPNGFCSFPDDDCPSGLRYGAQAPDGLANICVEPEDVAGTDSVTTECTTGACNDSDPSTTAPMTSAESTVGGTDTTTTTNELTTTEPGTGSATGPPETSGSSEGPGSSGGPPDNCLQIVDEFDDGMVDDLLWTIVDPSAVSEAAGTIRFAIDPQVGGEAGVRLASVDFVDATIRVDVVELSPLAEFPFRIELEAAPGVIAVNINGTESIDVQLDGETLASVPVQSPMAGVSLEVVSTLGGVYVLAGPVGAANLDLLPLGEFGLQYVAAAVRLSLLAGNSADATVKAAPFSVQIDRFSYCDAER